MAVNNYRVRKWGEPWSSSPQPLSSPVERLVNDDKFISFHSSPALVSSIHAMPKRDCLRNFLSSVAGPWKQKQERAQVESGTSASVVCDLCRNLDPNDPAFGDLFVWSSSPAGGPPLTCRFCRFIYESATAMVPDFASDSQIHASVESLPSRNRLDLRFGGRLAVQVYTRPGTILCHTILSYHLRAMN